jgi:hypothetical protein
MDHKNSTDKNSEIHQKIPVLQALQLTALFVGGVKHKQKESVSVSVSVSVWLLMSSDFVAYLDIFMESSAHNEIPFCKILYFVRGMGLLAE